jgi:hypothetical protein
MGLVGCDIQSEDGTEDLVVVGLLGTLDEGQGEERVGDALLLPADLVGGWQVL